LQGLRPFSRLLCSHVTHSERLSAAAQRLHRDWREHQQQQLRWQPGRCLIDYKPIKRVDVYAGVMISNVWGGLAYGHLYTQNVDPTVGLRIRF
jgi:hypothetical protein